MGTGGCVAFVSAGAAALLLALTPGPAGAGFSLDDRREAPGLNAILSPSGFEGRSWSGLGSGVEFSVTRWPEGEGARLTLKTPYGTQSLPYEAASPREGAEREMNFSLASPIEWQGPFGARLMITDSSFRVEVPKSDGEVAVWSFRVHGCGGWHITLPDGTTISAAGTPWAENRRAGTP